MKEILFSALCTAIAMFASNARAQTLTSKGTVSFSWTVYQQKTSTNYSLTNHTGTTVVSTTSVKAKSFTLSNASIIALLANSFDTTFPAGSKLVFSESGGPIGSIYLVDKTGTNVVQDISSVVSATSPGDVGGYLSTTTDNDETTETNYTTRASGTYAEYVTFNYDDSAQATADGTQSVFVFNGISKGSQSYNSTEPVTNSTPTTTATERVSFTVTGVGYGTIRGTNSVISGTVLGSCSGPPPVN
jgi:hypothetical protein